MSMTTIQDAKAKIEHVAGIWRPSRNDLAAAVRTVRPAIFSFGDAGAIPNNPKLPLVIYKRALNFAKKFDPAAVIEEVFASNGWGDGWRDSVYDWDHFHSKTHEVLGIAKGSARVRFGGETGREIAVAKGDVVVIPAGTGHMKIKASDDLLVVGAYPPRSTYDERKSALGAATRATIARVPVPKTDPIYGKRGGIMKCWAGRA
jgi:uncharacterized protein YjlB